MALVGYLMALIGIFLPFYTAVGEYREALSTMGYADMTFFNTIKLATSGGDSFVESGAAAFIRNLILFAIFLVEAVVSTFRGKPKAAVTGSIFLIVMNIFININMGGGEEIYVHGAGFYFMWIGVVLALAGNIWSIFYMRSVASNNINYNYANGVVPTPVNNTVPTPVDNTVPTPVNDAESASDDQNPM